MSDQIDYPKEFTEKELRAMLIKIWETKTGRSLTVLNPSPVLEDCDFYTLLAEKSQEYLDKRKKVCDCYCDCHRDNGMVTSHIQACCDHTYLRYLTKDGKGDKEACEKLGVIMIPEAITILNSKL